MHFQVTPACAPVEIFFGPAPQPRCYSENPLENDVIMATVARYLGLRGRRLLRTMALLLPRGQESVAEGAVPGCFVVGSVARRAANEAEECVKVRPRDTHAQ